MPDDKLPSINDWDDSKELPSVDDFLKEEVEEELPSVEDYIEEEEVKEEDIQIIDDADGNPFLEVTDVVKAPEWSELVRMVNDVRESIPDIPEVKYYDEELKQLAEHIEQVKDNIPEVKDYDPTVEAITEQIDLLRESVKDLPEVKYYDEQIDSIEDKIDLIQQEVTNLPEPKYYETDLQSIKEEVEKVRSEIPVFPKWVNEVNEVPDFSWIGKTFGVIDDDFIKVGDNIKSLRDRIDLEVNELSESLDIKDFEKKVEISEVKENLKETKDKIYKELKDCAIRIWDHHTQFKDDDRKLKKQVLSKLNETKQNIESQIKESYDKSYESNKTLKSYFDGLKEEIANLPKVKYYDDSIENVSEDVSKLSSKIEDTSLNIAELYKIVNNIKNEQKELLEIYNDRPVNPDPSSKEGDDPLTPTDQKFATLKDLAANYRLFVNRVEQQMYTIGGGGAGFIKDLDDVNIDGLEDGNTLVWNADTSKWDVGAGAGVGGTWASNAIGVHTTRNVGIATTARSAYNLYVGSGTTTDTVAYFDGHISVAGSIFSREVVEIESIGIITARSDLHVDGNTKTLGITTLGASTGVGTVHIGVGTTALLVDGDARITGILTVGRSSITMDGDNNQITVGLVTVTNSTIVIGSGVTIDAGASGINSAPNVLYVAKDGGDSNNGTSIDNAFLTIKAAVGAAQSGTTVKVLSGKYTEDNPISIPAFVSIVGDDQRTVEVTASNTTSDIFHVRKGDKLANMTFKGHLAPAAAVAFPTDEIAENVGGGKWKGPYVQNCTSDTTTGTGIYIDGDQARLLKAMNVDSFTQYNQGGIGVAVTNGGFAQLVSLFTICCQEAVRVDKGGQADIANSNCSFGTYGLTARGVSDLQYTGFVTTAAAISQAEVEVNVNTFAPEKTINNFVYDYTSGIATVTTTAAHDFQVGMGVTLAGIGLTCAYGSKTYPHKRPHIFTVDSIPSTTSFVVNVGISTVAHFYAGAGSTAGTAKIDVDRPYDGQMVYFDQLYKEVRTIAVSAGGTGYTSTPAVTIAAPSGPSGETASAYATVEDEAIKSITIISSGSQYTGTPDVTIAAPNVGINTATATASMDPLYYVINSSTPVSSGISTLTLASNLLNAVGVGSTAYFSQASRIVASSHTFEYVGAGNTITQATPKRGGVLNQQNEVLLEDGGKVLYTSTDQAGNFRIGEDLLINQETGTVSGRAFSKSLFSEITPFILALS
jgi:hypothetical protein